MTSRPQQCVVNHKTFSKYNDNFSVAEGAAVTATVDQVSCCEVVIMNTASVNQVNSENCGNGQW